MAEGSDRVELQRQLDELKRELWDTGTNTINWWLAVNGLIPTCLVLWSSLVATWGSPDFSTLKTKREAYSAKREGSSIR